MIKWMNLEKLTLKSGVFHYISHEFPHF